MIEVGLEFEQGMFNDMLTALLSLPEELRPISYSSGETEVGTSLENQIKFRKFVEKNTGGFFLKRPGSLLSIRRASGKPVALDAFVELGADPAHGLLRHLATAHPLFGYAAVSSEREWRNRVKVCLGPNKIEAWVGRDTNRYIPGIYWLTLLSRDIEQQHGISVDEWKQSAISCETLHDTCHLFQFYKGPEDWESARPEMDRLYEKTPNVFKLERLRPLLSGAKSFLELNSLLQQWK